MLARSIALSHRPDRARAPADSTQLLLSGIVLPMPLYRDNLPQLTMDRLFLTDGGLETTLVFHDGIDLPHFAAFDALRRPNGKDLLGRYFREYTAIAQRHGVGIVLETVTWRASADWARRLGYTDTELERIQHSAVELLEEIRLEAATSDVPVVISGCVGPRGDGYQPSETMSPEQAQDYHSGQIRTFSETNADLITAMTMNYVEEAIGVARAAKGLGMPSVISFTVETDGKLATGQTLRAAIEDVDAETDAAPAYYMINCAHPTHFETALSQREPWVARVQGIRANASTKSHAELNDSTELDAGDPTRLGAAYAALKRRLMKLNVMGGCCGTDARHVEAIATACAPLFARR